MKNILISFCMFVLITGSIVQKTFAATVYYVTTTGAGSVDGSSWVNAFAGLQAALNAAVSSDQIWVAKGTYNPSVEVGGTGNQYKTFQMKNGVAIYGGFAGTETSVDQRTNYGSGQSNETVLSGVYPCYHVFYHPDGLGLTSSAVLDGFTIKGGFANGASFPNCSGGGMFNYNNSPSLVNCTFTDNSTTSNGAGMFNLASSPTLTNCTFTNNIASYDYWGMGDPDPAGYHTFGGGMYNYNSSPTLVNCLFKENEASSSNSSYTGYSSHGGGMANEFSSSPTLTNCAFISNRIGGNGYGGGMSNEGSSSPILTNCTFSSNTTGSPGYGGGVSVNSSTATLRNCIIWGNTATNGNQLCANSSTITLNYSCYGNSTGDVSGSVSANEYCIVTDPQFVGAENNATHPYSIGGISPCCDTGNDSYCSETYDVRGSSYPRKLNKTTGETGTIDMGAYEYKFGTDASLPVEFTSFTAEFWSNGVLLNWTTESEIENLGFNLYRKNTSGEHELIAGFKDCPELTGRGTTTEVHSYSYTDQSVQPGAIYTYLLSDVNYAGVEKRHIDKTVTVTIPESQPGIAEDFRLGEVFPNPFNATFTIPLNLGKTAPVKLTLCDLNGKVVKIIENGVKPAGEYRIAVDCRELSSGIYFLITTIISQNSAKKIVLIK